MVAHVITVDCTIPSYARLHILLCNTVSIVSCDMSLGVLLLEPRIYKTAVHTPDPGEEMPDDGAKPPRYLNPLEGSGGTPEEGYT